MVVVGGGGWCIDVVLVLFPSSVVCSASFTSWSNSKMLRAFKFSVNKWECLMMGTSKLSSEPVLTDFEREIKVESDVTKLNSDEYRLIRIKF